MSNATRSISSRCTTTATVVQFNVACCMAVGAVDVPSELGLYTLLPDGRHELRRLRRLARTRPHLGAPSGGEPPYDRPPRNNTTSAWLCWATPSNSGPLTAAKNPRAPRTNWLAWAAKSAHRRSAWQVRRHRGGRQRRLSAERLSGGALACPTIHLLTTTPPQRWDAPAARAGPSGTGGRRSLIEPQAPHSANAGNHGPQPFPLERAAPSPDICVKGPTNHASSRDETTDDPGHVTHERPNNGPNLGIST